MPLLGYQLSCGDMRTGAKLEKFNPTGVFLTLSLFSSILI
jgi:hypothetical protein